MLNKEELQKLADAWLANIKQDAELGYLRDGLVAFARAVLAKQLSGRIEPEYSDEALRELLVRADSYMSLLWHRHTKPEARSDTDIAYEVPRAIGDLRAASAVLARQQGDKK